MRTPDHGSEFRKYSKKYLAANKMPDIGDLVDYDNERGVICSVEPLIMKTVAFRSYVPITREFTLVTKSYDTSCCIRNEVKERIITYLHRIR